MKNVSDKVVENLKAYILRLITIFFEIHAFYEIMWGKYCRIGQATWHMRIACWITKAINIYTHYEIVVAFPEQQWFYAFASMLRCTYISSLIPVSQKRRYIWNDLSAVSSDLSMYLRLGASPILYEGPTFRCVNVLRALFLHPLISPQYP
jgi:hypothetical protein